MTSIEWLVKELYTEMNMSGDGRVLDEILEEAKEMHKQEIIDAHDMGYIDGGNHKKVTAEMYFEETFVSKGSDAISSQTDENGRPLTYWGGLKDRTCTNSCSVVCGECQLPLPKQETLYTEEQISKAIALYLENHSFSEIIQSLKQPKKD